MSTFFDAHTHLNSDQLFDERENHMRDFIEIGGEGIVNVGSNTIFNTRGIEIAQQSASLFPTTIVKSTIGLHPYEVVSGNITENTLHNELKALQSLSSFNTKDFLVAIGEIGIDMHYPHSRQSLPLQKKLFELQCERARKLRLPVVIHSRDDRDTTQSVLENFKDLTIYFHCWSYGIEEIKTIQKNYSDFYIGFCGNISYPASEQLRKSLRYLIYNNEHYPDDIISGKIDTTTSSSLYQGNFDHLLIETDAPYLAPQSYRGKLNRPALIKENYFYISQLLKHDINKHIANNTKRLYNID